MRILTIVLAGLAGLWLSACEFWPQDLDALAKSVDRQVSGKTTALLLGGDVVVIMVEGSPLYQAPPPELEAVATDIATQAVEAAGVPLESIAVTFHEEGLTDDEDRTREFIFLVQAGRPVLQPPLPALATGPLTPEEIQASVDRLGDGVDADQRDCVLEGLREQAAAAGNPETLDPDTQDFLSAETWAPLDAWGKRLVLSQALTTRALFDCAQR